MHILMIAPEPFFEPRGTPFSEFHRIRALTDLGHTVDLVTYPFGQDVDAAGLRVIRCARPPFVRRRRSGRRWPRCRSTFCSRSRSSRLALRGRYDAVHSHEEGGVIGVLLAAAARRSASLRHALEPAAAARRTSHSARSGLPRRLRADRAIVVRRSRVVVVICPDLQETVRAIDAPAPVGPDRKRAGLRPTRRDAGTGDGLRAPLGLADAAGGALHRDVRGLSRARSAVAALQARPRIGVPMRGSCSPAGSRSRSRRARWQARDRHRRCGIFAGPTHGGRDPRVPADAADVLVSPRSTGTNTPLKIYQYLRSGRPIVATRLVTHTQVLNDEVAVSDAGDAGRLCRGHSARAGGQGVGVGDRRRAQHLAETKYSYDAYLARTREACELLFGASAAAEAGGVA